MSIDASHAYMATLPWTPSAAPMPTALYPSGAANTGLDSSGQSDSSTYGTVDAPISYNSDSLLSAAPPLVQSGPQTQPAKATPSPLHNALLLGASVLSGTALLGAIAAGMVLARTPAQAATALHLSPAPTLAHPITHLAQEHIAPLADAIAKDEPARLASYAPVNTAAWQDPQGARAQLRGMLKFVAPSAKVAQTYTAFHENKPVGFITVSPMHRSEIPNLAYWFTDAKNATRPKGSAVIAVRAAIADVFARHPNLQTIRAVTFADNKGSRGLIENLRSANNGHTAGVQPLRVESLGMLSENDEMHCNSPREQIAFAIHR